MDHRIAAGTRRTILGAVLLAASAPPGYAQRSAEPVSSGQEEATRVVLLVRPHDPLADALPGLKVELEPLGVQLVTAPPPDEEPTVALAQARQEAARRGARAVFWTARPDGRVTLFLWEPEGERLWRRPVPSAVGVTDGLTLIVRWAVQAVADRRPPDMEAAVAGPPPAPKAAPAPPAPVVVAPAPPSVPVDRATLDLALAYDGSSYASSTGWRSGATVAARWFLHRRWALGASYTYQPPMMVGNAELDGRIVRHPGAVSLLHLVPLTRAAVRVQALALVDHTDRSTTRAGSAVVTASPAAGRWNLGLGLRAGVEVALGPQLVVFADAGADAMARRTTFFDTPTTRNVLLEPRRIQPRAEVGVAWRP